MRRKLLVFSLCLVGATWAASSARAGAIRSVGKQIQAGTSAAAMAAESGGKTVASNVATAGMVTGGFVSRRAHDVSGGVMSGYNATRRFSTGVAHRTSSFAQKVWKKVW